MFRIFILFLFTVISFPFQMSAQAPFTNEGQVYVILAATNELATLEINPSNNAAEFTPLFVLSEDIKGLAYRKSENLLYGLDPDDFTLYQIGSDGVVVALTTLALEDGLEYLGAAITPDGRYLITAGSENGRNKHIARVDLESPTFAISTNILGGNFEFADFAVDPYTNILYAFDSVERQLYQLDQANNQVTKFFPMDFGARVEGLYFDAFGNLFGYGSRNNGIVGALFKFLKTDGDEVEQSTGGPNVIHDMASSPFTIEFQNDIDPKQAFPCETIDFVYTVANLSGNIQAGLDFQTNFPSGFTFSALEDNPFGGTLEVVPGGSGISIRNMTLPNGINTLLLRVEIGDIETGVFNNQADLIGIPAEFGGDKQSDYVRTIRKRDRAVVTINRVEEDSLYFTRFACIGQSLILDGRDYGSIHKWSNGKSSPTISVSGNGVYVLEASSGCSSIFVTYEVTSASCPFTIELKKQTLPDSTLPCTEVIFQYIFENDSGVNYKNLVFSDTLPEELIFLEILRDPLNGDLKSSLGSNILLIEGGTLPRGVDTLEVLVEVGNIAPGRYGSQARISGFPVEVGPFRLSDEPETVLEDSTFLIVQGVESDSFFLEVPLCTGNSLVLDGRLYGVDYFWDNGSREPTRAVSSPGRYELTVFDGCDPSFIFFEVVPGKIVDIEAESDQAVINLSQSVGLSTSIFNEGDSLFIKWTDPLDTTLTCLDCRFPIARPLETITYKVVARNEICADSAFVTVEVDNTRRVYAPTAFSPNRDGINDDFFIQSPDFGIIKRFEVYNRWGAVVYSATNLPLESKEARWDGTLNGERLRPNTYAWVAEIEFLDRKVEVFGGEVSVLR